MSVDVSKLTFAEIKTITVGEIYGISTPKAPPGTEFTGEFRIPKGDEKFLTIYGHVHALNAAKSSTSSPRLILRVKAPSIFFKWKKFGLPQRGEWADSPDSPSADRFGPIAVFNSGAWSHDVNIYERVEVPSE